ncbi:MAG TPA: hypothetical protein VM012_04905 [Flavitalea sp.]|nr:hypothetical protein [Flavitalea sp.]
MILPSECLIRIKSVSLQYSQPKECIISIIPTSLNVAMPEQSTGIGNEEPLQVL